MPGLREFTWKHQNPARDSLDYESRRSASKFEDSHTQIRCGVFISWEKYQKAQISWLLWIVVR